jgi:CubicO group peptidase (beta-lactamase class C family)
MHNFWSFTERFGRIERTTLALLMLVAWPCGGATRDRGDPRFAPLRGIMKRVSADEQLPALAVAVAHRGKLVFEEAIGWADVDRRTPATTDTPFALGGVTRALTATAVMTLVDRGKLALDRPASDYLDPRARLTVYEGHASDVTLRRLLTHSAGLPPHQQVFYADAGELPPPVRTTIRRYGIVVAPPGEATLESEIGYVVLGSLAARIARKDYVDLLGTDVLAPLGLGHTVLANGRSVEGGAVPYGEDRRPLPALGTDHLAAAGAWSSVRDLVRFGMFHLRDHLPDQQAVLKDEAILEMQKAGPPASGQRGVFHGLGWSVHEGSGGLKRVEQTSGRLPAATAHLALVPQEDLAVAVLANCRSAPAAARIVEEALALALLRGAAAPVPGPRPGAGAPARFVPDAALQGAWEGVLQTWEAAVPLGLAIEPSGAVKVTFGSQRGARLLEPRFDEGRLTGRVEGLTIPTADASRRKHVVELTLTPRGSRLTGWASAVLDDGRPYGTLASRVELWRPGTRPSPTAAPTPIAIPRGQPEGPPPSPDPTPPPAAPRR